MRTAAKLGVVALVALGLTVLPGGEGSLAVLLDLLTIAFLTAIAVLGYNLYRRHRFELDSLTERQRLVLYSSVGLAVLTLCASGRLFAAGGPGAVAWLGLLAVCSYGLYWVWTQYRSYG